MVSEPFRRGIAMQYRVSMTNVPVLADPRILITSAGCDAPKEKPVDPNYAALLRGICANPEDIARRLVFADWLDDNGQPERAELLLLSEQDGATIDYGNKIRRHSGILRLSCRRRRKRLE